MRQLTHDVKLDARTLNFISDVTFTTLRKTSNKGRYATLNVKNEKKTEIIIILKENNNFNGQSKK